MIDGTCSLLWENVNLYWFIFSLNHRECRFTWKRCAIFINFSLEIFRFCLWDTSSSFLTLLQKETCVSACMIFRSVCTGEILCLWFWNLLEEFCQLNFSIKKKKVFNLLFKSLFLVHFLISGVTVPSCPHAGSPFTRTVIFKVVSDSFRLRCDSWTKITFFIHPLS